MAGERFSAADFDFSADVLPEEIEQLVTSLEVASADPHVPQKKRKKGEPKKSAFRIEAEHYWAEACGMKFEEGNGFIAHALGALRERFRAEIRTLLDFE